MTAPFTLPTFYLPKGGRVEPIANDHDPDPTDPRGLILAWEPPRRTARYVVGIDPTAGIVGWDREFRTQDDLDIDNGVIEVIRIGAGTPTSPDVQVAEYAAPVDPEDLADVANILGRMYSGSDESEQAICIIEVWPGPGLLTQRRMINAHHYYNMYVWTYLDRISPTATNSLGWTSNAKTLRDLNIRCSRHIKKGNVVLRSPHLVEELADYKPDLVKLGRNLARGPKDDRVRAAFLAIWASHGWSVELDLDEQSRITTTTPASEWQSSDCSYSDMVRQWEERFADMLD